MKKITVTPGRFDSVQKLQSIDKDFECFQFENNGFQFKNQLNNRLTKAKKIYDHTQVSEQQFSIWFTFLQNSPEKNHAIFDKERE